MKYCMLMLLILVGCSQNKGPQVDHLVKADQKLVLHASLGGHRTTALESLLVFGDSLSDEGRLRQKTFGFYVPAHVYWQGRLSNGPIWTDYVCGALDCKSENYAVAGAATRLSSIPLRWIIPPLDVQVDEFLSESPLVSDKTVAVIWIGANNYLNKAEMKPDEARAEMRESAAALLKGPVQRLLIGTLPQLAGILQSPDGEAPIPDPIYRKVTAEHNRLTQAMIFELQKEFPNKSIGLFDAYTINQATIETPADYGFTSLTENCYKGNYRGQFHGAQTFCADHFGFKFWDYTHPNSRMHCYYGAQFLLSLHEMGWLEDFDTDKALAACRQL